MARGYFPPFCSILVKLKLLMPCSCEKATGGGAFKFADLFRERLGVSIEKEDEMDCLVAGANFLLKVNLFHFPFQLDFILVHYFVFPETGN